VPRAAWLALLLAATPGAAMAVNDALVDVYFGASQHQGVSIQQVLVRVDGLEVPFPSAAATPEQPLVVVPITSGPHAVEVEVALLRSVGFFTYVDDYQFKLRGRLDLATPSGAVTAVKASLVRAPGLLVPWEQRYRLELAAASYPSDRPEEPLAAASAPAPDLALAPAAPAPAPAPAPDAASAAAPAPGDRTPPMAASPACTLQPIQFAYNSARLDRTAQKALDRFAACLDPAIRAVRLEGHCDQRGSAAYNQRLGQRRVDAVLGYLRKRGVAAVRLSGISFGKSKPLCDEATETCHARNRRVEAVLDGG
jgi:peptidoglycan-associated lipoprotein